MSIRPYRDIVRRKSRRVMVGSVPVGDGAPITVQTMTNTLTADADATIAQIRRCEEAGVDIIRVSCPDEDSTKALHKIVKATTVPIVADIHFHYKRAIEAADAGAACLRINPGNIGSAERVREVSIRLYREAADHALTKGIIIADTKFEFGVDDKGDVVLIDEVLTPDSSRFWPADQYKPGSSPPSYDKQYVRDYLETLTWNKKPPAPKLPSYKRGEFTINRRFVETKLSSFFKAMPSEEEKKLVVAMKTARGEFVGRRITKITPTDLTLAIGDENAYYDQLVPFNDILEIEIRLKEEAQA